MKFIEGNYRYRCFF